MRTDARAYLSIDGFEDDFDAVTHLLGLAPTRVQRRGERLRGSRVVARHSLWIRDSPLGAEATLDAHLTALAEVLEPHADGVRLACERYDTVLQCVATYYDSCNPGVQLPATLLARLSALGVDVDFDLYVLHEPTSSVEPKS